MVPPPAPDEKKEISMHFFLDTGGKSIEELTAFPISGDFSPPPDTPAPEQVAATTNQSRPIVGIGARSAAERLSRTHSCRNRINQKIPTKRRGLWVLPFTVAFSRHRAKGRPRMTDSEKRRGATQARSESLRETAIGF
jgi:hypothetical protein